MRNFISHRLRLLKGSRGDAAGSLKEMVVNAPIRASLIAAAMAAAIVVVTLNSILSNSATASVRLNAGDIEFKQDVRAATLVHGFDTTRVALLTTVSGKCTIKQWFTTTIGGTTSLRSSSTTVAGECSNATVVSAPPAEAELRVDQLQSAPIVYENLGGRTITFDASSNPTLASGSKPADVDETDWNDLRPYLIRIDVKSANENLAKFSRQGIFTGTTAIVNVPVASDIRYVPPTKPIPTPSELRIASVVRSQTIGTVYSGAREGVTVTFTGGVCAAMPTTLNLTYTTTSPTGVAPVNIVTERTLTGAASTIDLAGVPNASTGSVALTAACGVGSAIKDAAANYHQELPAPTLTAVVGSAPEQHQLTWTAVSSLASSFRPSWSSDFGGDDAEAPTSNLAMTMRFAAGYTYGGTFTYVVTATVNGETAQSKPAKVTQAWPAAPAAQGITYTRTGYSGNFVSGTVKWSFATGCPAGTTLQAQQLENRTGQSNGTISSTVNYTGPWTASLTSVNWAPSYATQAYAYGMGVNTRCVSSTNGLISPVTAAQSANWITPWATPATPVWDAYNYRDWVRGTNWTYSTCLTAGCASMTVDYKTYCPAGTWVSWSNWISQSWTGGRFSHPIGYQDNWKLPDGSNAAAVYYMAAEYTCASPWSAASPHSPQSGTVGVTVYR